MSSMIKSREDVDTFLQQFMPKFDVWGIFFLDREKNEQALTMLGLTGVMREKIIRTIETCDYVETISDALSYGDMWVFGKDWDGTELYIKISMGRPGSKTICISFHVAEYKMSYAFKDKETKL